MRERSMSSFPGRKSHLWADHSHMLHPEGPEVFKFPAV